MSIAKRIKDLREDHDLTQQQVADLLKIDRKTYNRYEQEKHDIKLETLIELSKLYQVSLDFLCGLSDQLRPNNEFLTEEHIKLINAYESQKDLQKAVKKLLDLK